MTNEFIERLKREISDNVYPYPGSQYPTPEQVLIYLNSRNLIVHEGFTPMPDEATREIDNAYHSALPCTFDVAYRSMIATQKKED